MGTIRCHLTPQFTFVWWGSVSFSFRYHFWEEGHGFGEIRAPTWQLAGRPAQAGGAQVTTHLGQVNSALSVCSLNRTPSGLAVLHHQPPTPVNFIKLLCIYLCLFVCLVEPLQIEKASHTCWLEGHKWQNGKLVGGTTCFLSPPPSRSLVLLCPPQEK